MPLLRLFQILCETNGVNHFRREWTLPSRHNQITRGWSLEPHARNLFFVEASRRKAFKLGRRGVHHMRGQIGVVEFVDLDSLLPSAIVVGKLPDGGLSLWWNQKNVASSGWGGDCDLSFNKDVAGTFLKQLQEAKRNAKHGPEVGWEITKPTNYSWCDQDDTVSTRQGFGFVQILARKSLVRIIISHEAPWGDFYFTLPLAAVDRLIDLVQTVLHG